MCLAQYVARLMRRVASAMPGLDRNARAKQSSGPAPNPLASTPQQSAGVKLTLHIHRRAIRLHNRDVEKAAAYVRVHETMMRKGRSYD